LIECIYAPQPLFIGIPDNNYSELIEWEMVGEKIIVNLDEYSENGFPYIIDWGESDESFDIIEPQLVHLRD